MSQPRWRRAPTCTWRSTLRGVVVAATAEEPAVLVAGAGALVWAALDDEPSEPELVRRCLAATTTADESTVRADVGALLSHLRQTGLVEQVP